MPEKVFAWQRKGKEEEVANLASVTSVANLASVTTTKRGPSWVLAKQALKGGGAKGHTRRPKKLRRFIWIILEDNAGGDWSKFKLVAAVLAFTVLSLIFNAMSMLVLVMVLLLVLVADGPLGDYSDTF